MFTLQQFPTKRLNPVAGTRDKLLELDLYVWFPTKRLNPVAGTLNKANELEQQLRFPTKRLNPVAGTYAEGTNREARPSRFQQSDLTQSPGPQSQRIKQWQT